MTSSPAGIDCGDTCEASFDEDTVVTLSATAGAKSKLTQWLSPCAGAGTCEVTMSEPRSQLAQFDLLPGLYYTVTPCRLVDTRASSAPLLSSVPRVIPVSGLCGIPATAKAVTVNVTAVAPSSQGHVTMYPGDGSLPATSTINFTAGRTRANNAVVVLSADSFGTLAAQASLLGGGQVHLIVDVTGYFE